MLRSLTVHDASRKTAICISQLPVGVVGHVGPVVRHAVARCNVLFPVIELVFCSVMTRLRC